MLVRERPGGASMAGMILVASADSGRTRSMMYRPRVAKHQRGRRRPRPCVRAADQLEAIIALACDAACGNAIYLESSDVLARLQAKVRVWTRGSWTFPRC